MSQFNIVAEPTRSPTRCVACGTHRGPMVDLNVELYQLPTANGLIDVPGALYLCVGDAGTPGCLIQMARATGLLVDRSANEEMGEALDVARERIEDLERTLASYEPIVEQVQRLANSKRMEPKLGAVI